MRFLNPGAPKVVFGAAEFRHIRRRRSIGLLILVFLGAYWDVPLSRLLGELPQTVWTLDVVVGCGPLDKTWSLTGHLITFLGLPKGEVISLLNSLVEAKVFTCIFVFEVWLVWDHSLIHILSEGVFPRTGFASLLTNWLRRDSKETLLVVCADGE